MSAAVEYFEFSQLSEFVNKTALDVMFKVLESKRYTPGKTSEWVDQIGNAIIDKMRNTAPYFKFIVSSFIVQKVGAGIHYESIAHWDAKTDGLIVAKFENEEMICICSVIGVSL